VFQVTLEGIEPPGPLGSIRLQPRVELHQRFRTKPVPTSLRILPELDQPGIAQHLEMTGDTWLMHPDLLDQVAHRTLGLANRVEDPPPRRLGDHVEDFERGRHRT
jgi:hypothetical protein